MGDLSTYCVTTLPAESIDEAAKLMALAFSDSPAYNFIFQGDINYRKDSLTWLFQKNLNLIQRRHPSALKGVFDGEDSNNKLIACCMWTPSSHVKLSKWDMISAGLWLVPFKFGIATLRRFFQVTDQMESGEKDFFSLSSENSTFVMLERMAIHPDFQGQGLGTKYLKSLLSETNIPIRLVTQEHRNVTFYERLGFVVVGQKEMEAHPAPSKNADDDHNDRRFTLTFWFMVRDPPIGLSSDDSYLEFTVSGDQ